MQWVLSSAMESSSVMGFNHWLHLVPSSSVMGFNHWLHPVPWTSSSTMDFIQWHGVNLISRLHPVAWTSSITMDSIKYHGLHSVARTSLDFIQCYGFSSSNMEFNLCHGLHPVADFIQYHGLHLSVENWCPQCPVIITYGSALHIGDVNAMPVLSLAWSPRIALSIM